MSMPAFRFAACAVAPWPLLLLAACFAEVRSTTNPGTAVNVRISLRAGESVVVEGTGLRITFDSVASDSRCPADVNCIQAGEAVVDLVTDADGRAARVELRIPSPDRQRIAVGDFTIELVQLDPHPSSDRDIEPEEYRATLRVTRQ